MAAICLSRKLLLSMVWVAIAAAEEPTSNNATAAEGERRALLEFKAGAGQEAQETLKSWREEEEGKGGVRHQQPYHCGGVWRGVVCSADGRVIRLHLPNLRLQGSVEPLTRLRRLRSLTLQYNLLTGSVHPFCGLRRLRLSHNLLSGVIPASISTRLRLLDLSHNLLSGSVPDLRRISPNLTAFNVSYNLHLFGPVPPSLSIFPASSFLGDSGLCGGPLSPCGGGAASVVVSSTLASQPGVVAAAAKMKKMKRLGTGALIPIVVGCVAVVVAVSCYVVVYCFGKNYDGAGEVNCRKKERRRRDNDAAVEEEKAAADKGKLVFTGGGKGAASEERFEMEDLLRASAEMLGKGTLGVAYKAVMEGGRVVVAVKRLKDVDGGGGAGGGDFEQLMEIVGNLTHPNIVRLRAYYSAPDQKLLVYDYLPSGNLYTLLHGNRGPGRMPLDWTTRVRIALGAARGLAHIHNHRRAHKLPHGNIKSTNVLLDRDGNACISDFGLALLAHHTSVAGYRAPEHNQSHHSMSQKGDVYSFGVVLLEILTGKAPVQLSYPARDQGFDLPKWVQSVVQEEWTAEVFDVELLRYKNVEEEMVGMLQIAMQCVSQVPEQRPQMRQVVKMIEGILARGEHSLLGEDSGESISRSPSVSEDTGTSH